MTKIITAALLFTASITINAHAGFISGSQTLSNGNAVALQGLEWMPFTYTAGFSRDYVSSTSGWTDRFNNTWSSNDWRYATRTETETLINSLWGGVFDGYSSDNAIGAEWFIRTFGGLAYDTGFGNSRQDGKYTDIGTGYKNLDSSSFFFGQISECTSQKSVGCYGYVVHATNFDRGDITGQRVKPLGSAVAYQNNSGALGFFGDSYGGNFGLTPQNMLINNNNITNSRGSMLVRTSQAPISTVPTPSPITLLALGLIGLVWARRAKTAG